MRLNRVLETCLYVQDIARTKDFYAADLGLALYSEAEGRQVFFKLPDGGMLLFFKGSETSKEGQGPPSHHAEGPQHLAFEVSKEDYPKWKVRISGATALIHEQTWKNDVRSFYFRDPDGHLVEICEPGMWS